MKIRVRFEKDGGLRFVGHLDVMRFFHKAFQRAGVQVRFTEGFHPHPVMSFASPLSVGLRSRGEYLDTEVEVSENSREMTERLNREMVPGIRVTQFRRLPEVEGKKGNSAMALVGLADYRVKLISEKADFSASELAEKAVHFLECHEILTWRKTKHREEETDIRPWIHRFEFFPETEEFIMRLSAGSESNCKPETVMSAFLEFCGISLFPEGEAPARESWLSICRMDLLTADGISLGDLGEDIQ